MKTPEYNGLTAADYQKDKLPFVHQHFGVQYPDMRRVVNYATEAEAHAYAAAHPGAVAVSRHVSDWLPLRDNG